MKLFSVHVSPGFVVTYCRKLGTAPTWQLPYAKPMAVGCGGIVGSGRAASTPCDYTEE
jgi:hypothetical protein